MVPHNTSWLKQRQPFPLQSSPKSRDIAADTLWIGNASFPRHRRICEEVLKLKPQHKADLEPSVMVVGDLEADNRFVGKSWRQNGARFRFYAGVPLISPDGAIIGTCSLFDENPRAALGRNEVKFLLDMSATVMEQLSSHKIRRHQERGELVIRGLTRKK
jgi:GAF domain-containing protein